MRLGIAGLGTVGIGVVRILNRHGGKLSEQVGKPFEIKGICARNRALDRGVDLSSYTWYDDPCDLARADDIDVFVELMGGAEGAAREAVEAALAAGKHVVTANKALLATHGSSLARRAEEKGVALNFEAAVAGGIPIIKTMRESLAGNDIRRVYGILNGTCNYILTTMQKEGRSFGDILADAQRAGYAEADPTFDIGGFDTAHKLAILTSLAFGTEPALDDIYIEGIERIGLEDIRAADELGYRIKLLGVALKTESGIEQRVHPTMVSKHSALAEVDSVTNCVAIEGDFVGDILLIGAGAGAGPTASAVISDIVDIAWGVRLPPLLRRADLLRPYQRSRMRAHEGGYYIRLLVKDHPGAFAAIARRMAEHGISLQSIMQKGHRANPAADVAREVVMAPVVLITHETSESAVREALAAITSDGHVARETQMIRIEAL